LFWKGTENPMKKAVAFLILCLMAPVTAGAQDLASLEQMRQAAEQGNADAQLEMGILYEFGYNMPKNDVNALAWYMHAADQGNELAVKRRDLLKSRMSPEEIDAAQKLYSEVVAGKTQKPEAPPAVDTKPQTTDATQPAEPATKAPSSPGIESPAPADGKSEGMEAPAAPVTEAAPPPAIEKPPADH
jgi:TPR repeat protein